MKQMADHKRDEKQVEIGDMAYLCLQPYHQTSVQFVETLRLLLDFMDPLKFLLKLGQLLIDC